MNTCGSARQGERGSVIILMVVVLCAGLLFCAAEAARLMSQSKSALHARFQTSATIIAQKIQMIAASNASWQATIADTSNGNLGCFTSQNALACTPYAGKTYTFTRLYDEDGKTLFYDSSTQGLGHDGLACFPDPGGCPFTLLMQWTPTCTPSSCQASITIQVQMNYSGQLGIPFNPKQYLAKAVH